MSRDRAYRRYQAERTRLSNRNYPPDNRTRTGEYRSRVEQMRVREAMQETDDEAR